VEVKLRAGPKPLSGLDKKQVTTLIVRPAAVGNNRGWIRGNVKPRRSCSEQTRGNPGTQSYGALLQGQPSRPDA
jgi:hypothetical protein